MSGSAVLGGLVPFLAALPIAQALAVGGGAPLEIRVDDGLVSVNVAGSPLEDVLGEISARSGARLSLAGPRREHVVVQFHSVRVEEAFRRLIGENTLFLYGSDGQVVEIWVWSAGGPMFSLPRARDQRAETLRSLEDASVDALIGDLHTGAAERRGRAVLLLGELGDERIHELVIAALRRDEDPDVRQRAIWALERLGGEKAAAALAEAVSGDGDGSVRNMAVEALARVGGEERFEQIARALRDDPDPLVRYKALVSLAEVASDRLLVGVVRQALGDPEELVRTKAEEILAAAH